MHSPERSRRNELIQSNYVAAHRYQFRISAVALTTIARSSSAVMFSRSANSPGDPCSFDRRQGRSKLPVLESRYPDFLGFGKAILAFFARPTNKDSG
jgi:hypothetical protein